MGFRLHVLNVQALSFLRKGVRSAGNAATPSAPDREFDAEEYFPENKTLRLMNRDAQMAVVAARLAMEDAAIRSGGSSRCSNIACTSNSPGIAVFWKRRCFFLFFYKTSCTGRMY